MKAARIHRFGGPEVITVEEVERRAPRAGELCVKVIAGSVNPVDYKIRQGGFLPEDKLPLTLGRDVCGIIEAQGDLPEGWHAGEAVFAQLPMEEGGNAEYVVAPASAFARKPHNLDDIGAGALGLASLTAWQGLFDHGGLCAGQRVLIHGAAGGVGHLAVQFARAKGAEVAATCAGEDIDFVRRLGATQVIDYQAQRFETEVHDVDLVYDLIGGETQNRSWQVLKPGGVMVSTLTEPDRAQAEAHRARGVHYMAKPSGAQLREVAELVEHGKVTPHIHHIFPLSEIAAAHRMLEHDHVRGKIVIRIS